MSIENGSGQVSYKVEYFLSTDIHLENSKRLHLTVLLNY